ncbi:MAG: hypothetical protein NTZ49_03935 [Candidatus Parcubacteria bacterium]|nr:hypothetical protein [Candidatus Parcubacteria bacterium]
MPQKMQDITKRNEKPQGPEIKPEPQIEEAPIQVETAPKAGLEQLPAMPGPVEEVKGPAEAMPEYGAAPAPAAPQKSPTLEKIEDILEEDLEQIYFQMPAQKQSEFREVGQETASRIETLMMGVKINVKKILELIIRWLKIIPGINKFFLEQEAKIKTDELLKLRQDQQDKPVNDKNRIK